MRPDGLFIYFFSIFFLLNGGSWLGFLFSLGDFVGLTRG